MTTKYIVNTRTLWRIRVWKSSYYVRWSEKLLLI